MTAIDRRSFLQSGLAATAGLGIAGWPHPAAAAAPQLTKGTADAVIYIWLPGGVAQTDTWDPKGYTPFRAGRKGAELRGTGKPIPTAADGVFLGEGLESLAGVM